MSPENKATLSKFIGCTGDLSDFDLLAEEVEAIMNAVRAEERARAMGVVKPFAEEGRRWLPLWPNDHVPICAPWGSIYDEGPDAVEDMASFNVGDLRRAAVYIADNQGEA